MEFSLVPEWKCNILSIPNREIVWIVVRLTFKFKFSLFPSCSAQHYRRSVFMSLVNNRWEYKSENTKSEIESNLDLEAETGIKWWRDMRFFPPQGPFSLWSQKSVDVLYFCFLRHYKNWILRFFVKNSDFFIFLCQYWGELQLESLQTSFPFNTSFESVLSYADSCFHYVLLFFSFWRW